MGMYAGIVKFLLHRRIWSLAIVALLTVAAFIQLPTLKIDNSNESFFLQRDPVRLQMEQFKADFGNDDFVFVLVDSEQLFEAATLQRLGQLVARLEQQVPHLLEVTWIGNAEAIRGVPGGILIEELLPRTPVSASHLQKLGERVAADPAYRNRLVSADGRSAGILLEFENYPDQGIDPRKDSPPVIARILAEFDDLSTQAVGIPVINTHIDTKTAAEGPIWVSIALLGMCVLLLFTTRSLTGVLVPAATVILSVIWTLALVASLNFSLNMLAIMLPTLLLCVGIGDSMHVVAELRRQMAQGLERKPALRQALASVGKPMLLTTLTTSGGFLAFLFTDLAQLRELGLQAAMGVWIALILTYLFAVPVLSFGRETAGRARVEAGADGFERVLGALAAVVTRSPRQVAICFAGVILAALYGLSQLKIETGTVRDLPVDDPLRQAVASVDQRMGGAMSLELVIDSGADDGIKSLPVMRAIEDLQAFIDRHPLVMQSASIVDQLKQMHRAVHENSADHYQLPSTSGQIAEYLLLYESAGGGQLEQFVTFPYDKARIQIRTKNLSLTEIRRLEEDIQGYLDRSGLTDLTIYTTGTLAMFRALGDHIAAGQLQSFMFAFAVIAIAMMLVLRSLKLGLIAMLPNIFPVLVALGALGLFGGELNVVMLVLAPMILGVAVDDTIHFFVRYRRCFDQYGSYDKAHVETLRSVGRPLLFTTLVLVAGFGGFLLSDFQGPRTFAWASALAFVSALAADFLLAPLLLRWLKPLQQSCLSTASTSMRPST